jgi:hypothetical protein
VITQLPLGRGLLAGLFGTLAMDLGSTALRAAGLVQGVPMPLLSRWFGHVLRGRVVHADIAAAADVAFPMPLALALHYAIGLALGIAGATLYEALWQPRSVGLFAIGFGVVTNVLPWLVMFPAMGYGWLGSAAPPEWLLLRTSFVNHVLYGVGFGLALAWRAR